MSFPPEASGGDLLQDLSHTLESAAPADVLRVVGERVGKRAVLASSLGLEDVMLLDLVAKMPEALRPRIVTLDTGRLHPETYELLGRLEAKYGLPIEVQFPDRVAVESLVRRQGINGFYASLEARHACCDVRKVEPLGRALVGVEVWITGLRRSQATTRSELGIVERDGGRVKVNPLAALSQDDVWSYVRANGVPFNELHERGFPSIGCAPCTRAVEPGEEIRAGRFWWENADHRECGIHTARAAAVRAAAKRGG